jgi:hypothetical protein
MGVRSLILFKFVIDIGHLPVYLCLVVVILLAVLLFPCMNFILSRYKTHSFLKNHQPHSYQQKWLVFRQSDVGYKCRLVFQSTSIQVGNNFHSCTALYIRNARQKAFIACYGQAFFLLLQFALNDKTIIHLLIRLVGAFRFLHKIYKNHNPYKFQFLSSFYL